MFFRKIRFLFFGFFILFFTGCSSLEYILDKNNYLDIGVIVPLSSEGVGYGQAYLDVLNYTFYEINLNGGINGKKLNLIAVDGKCSRVGGKLAAKELVEKGVKIIIGGVCSDETLGAALITEPNQIILFTPISVSSDISYAGDFVFRNGESSDASNKFLADRVYVDGNRKTVVINEFSVYTDSMRREYKKHFEALGGEVVYELSFDTYEEDFSNLFNEFIEIEFDSYYLIFQNNNVVRYFLNFFETLNISQSVYMDAFVYRSIFDYSKYDNIIGAEFVYPKVDLNNESINLLYGNLNGYHSKDFKNYIALSSLVLNYDSVYILKEIIERNNCDFKDTVCIRDGFYSLDDFSNLEKDIRFDKNGDRYKELNIFKFNKNSIEIVS